MPSLDRSKYKYNAKVFEKTCLYCGTVYFANRSTAKYCTSTCRGYASQANSLNEAAPWNEEDRTVDALLSQVAYLKGQLQHYIHENEELKKNNFSNEKALTQNVQGFPINPHNFDAKLAIF